MAPGSQDLEALVSRSYQTAYRKDCWATRLEGPAAEYVAALKAAIDTDPERKPVWRRVAEILATEFEVDLAYDTVRRHVQGDCTCQR